MVIATVSHSMTIPLYYNTLVLLLTISHTVNDRYHTPSGVLVSQVPPLLSSLKLNLKEEELL